MKTTKKNVFHIALAVLMAVLMSVSVFATGVSATALDANELPNAEVIELGYVTLDEYSVWNNDALTEGEGSRSLQIAMQFSAKDTAEQAAANAYGSYTTDFFISMTGLEEGSFTADDCYLAGNYGAYGWILIPLDGLVIEDGKVYPVITSAGLNFSYFDICNSVQNFMCGIYVSDAVLEANPDLEITLELGLSENFDAAQSGEYTRVDESYTYTVEDLTPELPNAKVVDLGSIEITDYNVYDGKNIVDGDGTALPLQIAMQFLAIDTPAEAAANFYGDYITDFYITITGLENGSFTADDCYLAGNYGTWGWVKVPLDGMTVENDKVYPVITSVGAKFTYVNICESVQDFMCGIHLSDEVLEANPDLKVTLELGLSETMDDAGKGDFILVGDSYVYDVSQLQGAYAKFVGANVTLGSSLTVNYKIALGATYVGATVNFYQDGVLAHEGVVGVLQEDGTYVYSFDGISPQCMGDTIKAEVCYEDTIIATMEEYSVKANLASLKTNYASNAALLTLIDNTIAYGAAAQQYKGYKTDALVDADWEYTSRTTVTPLKSDISLSETTDSSVRFTSANVWFDNVNYLEFKYTGEATVYATVNGNVINCTVADGVIKTPAITARGMNDVYTIELQVGGETVQTLEYSVASYVYAKVNGTNEAMKNLAIALYNYGFAADAYVLQSQTFDVVVENGTASGTYSYGTELALVANTAEDGYVFSHWVDGEGDVVGTEATLNVVVLEDATYTAIFVQDLKYTYDSENNTYTVAGRGNHTSPTIVVPSLFKGVPVTAIANSAFASDETIVSVFISEGVTTVGARAFDTCPNIIAVVLPKSVTNVGYGAFMICTDIEVVAYGGTLVEWHKIVFGEYNDDLVDAARYYYSETKPTTAGDWFYIEEDGTSVYPKQWDMEHVLYSEGLEYKYDSTTNTYTVVSMGDCTDVTIVIPETFNGAPVVAIATQAFYKNTGIESVVIPGTVKTIGSRAFGECVNLAHVTISAGVETVEYCAFISCNALESVWFAGTEAEWNVIHFGDYNTDLTNAARTYID